MRITRSTGGFFLALIVLTALFSSTSATERQSLTGHREGGYSTSVTTPRPPSRPLLPFLLLRTTRQSDWGVERSHGIRWRESTFQTTDKVRQLRWNSVMLYVVLTKKSYVRVLVWTLSRPCQLTLYYCKKKLWWRSLTQHAKRGSLRRSHYDTKNSFMIISRPDLYFSGKKVPGWPVYNIKYKL